MPVKQAAHAPIPVNMLQPGDKYQGLTIICHCGGGAYGQVYYCSDISGKHLALKIISKLSFGANWARELNGITNYRKLSEDIPGLLRIYHVGEDESSFYYTMEPADELPDREGYAADTLARRLESGPLGCDELVRVLQKIIDGIAVLHEAGFAHRDIKPDNILFISGEPKLADLGLLSPLNSTLTTMVGTLDFLPPEVRSGEVMADSREMRCRNDLYAFGKLIYCCVTGLGADRFPSWPASLSLKKSPVSGFFRLSEQLCSRYPMARISSISRLRREFELAVNHVCGKHTAFGEYLRHDAYAAWRRLGAWSVALRRNWVWIAGFVWGMVLSAFAGGRYWLSRPVHGNVLDKALQEAHTARAVKEMYLASQEMAKKQREMADSGTVGEAGRSRHGRENMQSTPAVRWQYSLSAAGPGRVPVERAAEMVSTEPPVAGKTAKYRDFSFYHGRYTLSVPQQWRIFDHEAIASARLAGDKLAGRLYGLFQKNHGDGANEDTNVVAVILPKTRQEISAMDDGQLRDWLKEMTMADADILSLRRFYNLRQHLDMVMMSGMFGENPGAVCRLYLQEDHAMALVAYVRSEYVNEDMPQYLAMNDTMVWRSAGTAVREEK